MRHQHIFQSVFLLIFAPCTCFYPFTSATVTGYHARDGSTENHVGYSVDIHDATPSDGSSSSKDENAFGHRSRIVTSSITAAKLWTHETFPNPEASSKECHSAFSRLCDPDSILDESEKSGIASAIENFEGSYRLNECEDLSSSSSSSSGTDSSIQGDNHLGVPLQIAVALVNKMDLTPFQDTNNNDDQDNDPIDAAARAFAMGIHDKWGVGSTTSCGGTGVVIFLSVDDRAVFVSIGSAVKHILTPSRVDDVIEQMKPQLRREQYSLAIIQSLDYIGGYIQRGPPSLTERIVDVWYNFGGLIIFGSVVGLVFARNRYEHQQSRQYAEVQSQLTKLDRDRALALSGRYKCTSCPICLENFGETPSQTRETNEEGMSLTENNSRENDELPRFGSDGLPLKLFRCGHVFDETCWSQWVTSGRGDVRRCPICQQDVGGSPPPSPPPPDTSLNDNTLRTRNDRSDREILIRDYNRERNFRLMRLGCRYPRYVGPQQIQRWTSDGFDGSLARDPNFVRNDPRRDINTLGHRAGGRTGMSSGSFGGGRSAGGRGGRW